MYNIYLFLVAMREMTYIILLILLPWTLHYIVCCTCTEL